MRKLDILLLMGVEAVLLCAGVAVASRNNVGTMSAINGPYAAPNVISSSAINARFADIETEITNSVDKGGRTTMTGQLPLYNGTSTSPSFGFASETTAGFYRAGAGDFRWAFNGTDALKVQSTGITVPGNVTLSGASSVLSLTGTTAPKFGIGGAPTFMLDLIVPGSASTTVGQWLEASLGDGNSLTTYYGKALAGGQAGIVTYTKNATSANSKLCLGVFGGAVDTACVDGNNKFYIGSTGTAISASYRGTTSWTPGVIGTNACVTTTISLTGAAAGADCAVTIPGGTPVASIWTACSVTLNTCNLYDCNADNVNTHIGLIGTYACRVFNP